MQIKKRAKPVKFGIKEEPEIIKAEDEVKEIEPTKEVDDVSANTPDEVVADNKAEEVNESISQANPLQNVEAHYSRVETFDIKPVPVETPAEVEHAEVPAEVIEEKVETPIVDVAQDTELTPQDASDGNINPETNEEVVASDEESNADIQDTQDEEVIEQSDPNGDGAFFNSPDSSDGKKSKLKSFFTIAFIAFLLGLTFFAGIFYAVSNKNSINIFPAKEEVKPTVAPITDVPTEAPVDLTKYDIQVLNGTATSGVAARVRDLLTTDGFTVASVGNAGKADFTTTEISASDNVDKKYLDKLKESLGKTYQVGTVTDLATGSADVVVTVGSELAK